MKDAEPVAACRWQEGGVADHVAREMIQQLVTRISAHMEATSASKPARMESTRSTGEFGLWAVAQGDSDPDM